MLLKDKTVLVTGGAVRIGRAIADRLAQEGARVCVQYNRSETEAHGWLTDARAAGGDAYIFQAELSSEQACDDLFAACVREAGPVDMLVNNASVFRKHTLDESDMAAVLGELWPNTFAPLQLMRALAAQDRPGQIVNLLDRRITALDTSCAPYWLSKKMLADITALAALHWAPRIRVNAVAPGPILPPPGRGDDYMKEFAGHVPLERTITTGDIVEAVFFLLSQESLTGQTIFVDGGQHLSAGKLKEDTHG